MMIGMIGMVEGSTLIAALRVHLGSTVRVRNGLTCLVQKTRWGTDTDDSMIR